MKLKYLLPALALVLSACKKMPDKEQSETFYHCGVVFGFEISPEGELEKFTFFPPYKCGGGLPNVEVSLAWKKTACGYFSTENKVPTYKKGEEPVMRYSYYLINPNRPDVVYPTKTAGSSESDPVIYVQESILEGDGKNNHACDRMIEEEIEKMPNKSNQQGPSAGTR